MQPTEWAHLVARLNLNWPGQQVSKLTADEWYSALQGFPAREVWEAVDRCRRDLTPGRDGQPVGQWAPTLAGILAAIDANWREQAATRRELEARTAHAARYGRSGVPMPPETKTAVELLERSKLTPGNPDRLDPSTARERIEALAAELGERLDREKAGQLA